MLGKNFEILLYCPKIRKRRQHRIKKKTSQTHSFRLRYIKSFINDYITYIITWYMYKISKMG